MTIQFASIFIGCLVLSGCASTPVLSDELAPMNRTDCVILDNDIKYPNVGLIGSTWYTVKSGTYRPVSENENGVYYAGEAYPLETEVDKSWNDTRALMRGGLWISKNEPRKPFIFIYSFSRPVSKSLAVQTGTLPATGISGIALPNKTSTIVAGAVVSAVVSVLAEEYAREEAILRKHEKTTFESPLPKLLADTVIASIQNDGRCKAVVIPEVPQLKAVPASG